MTIGHGSYGQVMPTVATYRAPAAVAAARSFAMRATLTA